MSRSSSSIRLVHHGHGRVCGRSGGERSHLPLRHRQGVVRQTSLGKRVVVAEFAGYSLHAGNRRRFQWSLPRDRRPRGEFVLHRRPAITDQQSKVFSNQLPVDSIQSMEVISGAPPAEYGGKTSVVIVATTRSGQGVTTPHGSVTASYGAFGSSNVAADLAYGGKNWGNFISIGGLNTGRFLDPPEFAVIARQGQRREPVRPRGLINSHPPTRFT
jgi:hypothetical protein